MSAKVSKSGRAIKPVSRMIAEDEEKKDDNMEIEKPANRRQAKSKLETKPATKAKEKIHGVKKSNARSKSGRAIKPVSRMIAEDDAKEDDKTESKLTAKNQTKPKELVNRQKDKIEEVKRSSTRATRQSRNPSTKGSEKPESKVSNAVPSTGKLQKTEKSVKENVVKPLTTRSTRVSRATVAKKVIDDVPTKIADNPAPKRRVAAKAAEKPVNEKKRVQRKTAQRKVAESNVASPTKNAKTTQLKVTKSKETSPKKTRRALNEKEIAELLAEDDEEEIEELGSNPVSSEQQVENKNEADEEVSFNFSRRERKRPIYMKTFSPEKKITAPDPYDDFGDDDEDAPKPKKSKKTATKKPRKPRKQKAGMILAFDSNRTQVAQVVKQIKNLKTPVKPQPTKNVKSSSSTEEKADLPQIVVTQSPSSSVILEPASSFSIKNLSPVASNSATPVREPEQFTSFVSPTNVTEDVFIPPPAEKSSEKSPASSVKTYVTPQVPKHMSKMIHERKASTPRVDEKQYAKKNYFGFDDSANSSEGESLHGESLAGFSPVKSLIKRNNVMFTPSAVPAKVPNSSMKSRPMRFEFKMPTRAPVSKPSANTSSKHQGQVKQKPAISATQPVNSTAMDDAPPMEISLFDEAVEEVKEPEPGPVLVEREQQNAFEVMKKGKKSRTKKPLKTVTNTTAITPLTKKTKQSLIYEQDGGKKSLKCKKAKR